ncbi:MAG: hypothetical protein LIO77_06115 [Rikenellaceae bacterium]|nr:hypothetical protein [Rikenellaceae bacterium]
MMQTDVTMQSFGATIVQFLLLAALFWASSLCGIAGTAGDAAMSLTYAAEEGSFLPGFYINGALSHYPAAAGALTLLLIFVNAFLITKTVSRNLVYATRTYLPAIFYLLVACGICFPVYDLSAVVAAWLLVQASIAFISSFVRSDSFGSTFKGAFFIGITPLLDPPNAIYLLMIPAAMAIFRRGGRETFVALIGSLLPALFTAYIWWACGNEFTGLFVDIWREFTAGFPQSIGGRAAGLSGAAAALASTPAGIARLLTTGLLAVTLIMSAVGFFTMSSDMRTRAYKIHIYAIWFLLLAVISLALPSGGSGNFPVLAIPAAILAPVFFVKHRSPVPTILYILLVASAAAASIIPIITYL